VEEKLELHRKFHRRLRPLRYEPVPVVQALQRVRRISDVAVDLAYHVYLTGDTTAISHLLDLWEDAEYMVGQAVMHVSMVARDAEDALNVLGFLKYANSIERIVDSALDIAYIALVGYRPSEEVLSALSWYGGEVVCKLIANERMSVDVEALQDKYPVDVVLIGRGGKWLVWPRGRIEVGDVVYVRGFQENLVEMLKELGYPVDVVNAPRDERLRKLAESVGYLRDISKTFIDLAHVALMTGDEGLAEELDELEVWVDAYHIELLKSIAEITTSIDHRALVGLTWLVHRLEDIVDSSEAISSITLTDPQLREVFVRVGEALGEGCELVVVRRGGVSLSSLTREVRRFGAYVPAVKRNREWVVVTKGLDLSIEEGDQLIVIYPVEFREEVRRVLAELATAQPQLDV